MVARLSPKKILAGHLTYLRRKMLKVSETDRAPKGFCLVQDGLKCAFGQKRGSWGYVISSRKSKIILPINAEIIFLTSDEMSSKKYFLDLV